MERKVTHTLNALRNRKRNRPGARERARKPTQPKLKKTTPFLQVVGKALARTLNEGTSSQITIYDSGASTHMSPNRERFSEFRTIALKGVKAADKIIFMATSIGCMKIDIPNRRDSTAITLKDVLYCPDLGYTLVTLVKYNATGFTVTLKYKSCCIKRLQIGQIPQYQGLY